MVLEGIMIDNCHGALWFSLMLQSQNIIGFVDWRTPLWFWEV